MWKSTDGNKPPELTPEDIEKVMGMKPDQIKAMLDLVPTLKTKMEEQDTKLGGIEDIKTTLAQLSEKLKTPAIKPNNSGGNNNNNNNNNNNDGSNNNDDNFDERFLLDPKTVIKELIAQGTGGVAATAINTSAEMAYNNFRLSKRDFAAFEKEVKEEWDKFPVQAKTNPSALVENIYNMVRGRHQEEVLVDHAKKDGRFFIESGGSATSNASNNGGGDKKPEDQLSQDELDICKKWDIKPEAYIARKKARAEGTAQFV